ncbi:MAG: ATP-binding protein [Pseudomonadota bacterium]|nr:ATP-binding protein [Pseudomonadota bacterium]
MIKKIADRVNFALPDTRSIVGALIGGVLFAVVGFATLRLTAVDSILAPIWIANAICVALLLKGRLGNELPATIAIFAGSVIAHRLAGTPLETALFYSVANVSSIVLITFLSRRHCSPAFAMTDLSDLGRFMVIGGIVGPALGASISAVTYPAALAPMVEGMSFWFLAESMGMVLVVPAIALAVDALNAPRSLSRIQLAERIVLTVGGLVAVYYVFEQDTYPLLFMAPPITLLLASRLGGLGIALFVMLVAAVASWMTFVGLGPIVQNHTTAISKIYVFKSFIAANFLSGLPIVAILAGRERLTNSVVSGQRELALLANNITDAVLKLDRNGICTYASPSVKDVLGRHPDEFVGKPVAERTHEDASERIAAALAALQSGESDKERLTYRRLHDDAQGMPVFIEADCAVAIAPETGEREGIIISARDVTERVELELLLTRARRHAENAASAKSEFLANMSHEIRTPMNGVLGFAELMLQGELEPETRRHTEMIVESGRSMMLLLNDILDLSKIEAGQIVIDKQPVDLHRTLDECVSLHRANASSKGLDIKLMNIGNDRFDQHGEAPSSLFVLTDGLRLRQIVLNLIGNAVKFTETGAVQVLYEISEKEIAVSIQDSGIGISADRIEQIFQPFTQAEGETTRRFDGAGLGLSISRQLAELLGGFIEAESVPGAGSTFKLVLPGSLVEHEADIAPEPRKEPPVETATLPRDARILLAEDHDVNRLLVSEMLKRCGQTVAVAHDGNEAISMVIDSMVRGTPYDLVLMDVQMPGCDGYAASRAIWAEGITPDQLPIVALTANAFPENVAAARDAGMQAHLAKPLVFAKLAKALQR